jgi:hypothetical protein
MSVNVGTFNGKFFGKGRIAGVGKWITPLEDGVIIADDAHITFILCPQAEHYLTIGINPPTELTAVEISTAEIDLSWVYEFPNGEDGFKIERQIDAGGFIQIDTRPLGITTYNDITVSEGHTYDYRVRAYKGANNSEYSNVRSITITIAPRKVVRNGYDVTRSGNLVYY